MKNDIIQIKQDAIEIQKSDIEDTIKGISDENTKSSFVLGVVGVFVGFLLNSSFILPLCWLIVIGSFVLFSAIIAFYNIASKPLKTHNNVDSIFVKNKPDQLEEYLNCKHLRLNDAYKEAKSLLYKKALLTKIAYILLLLSLFISLIYKIYTYV